MCFFLSVCWWNATTPEEPAYLLRGQHATSPKSDGVCSLWGICNSWRWKWDFEGVHFGNRFNLGLEQVLPSLRWWGQAKLVCHYEGSVFRVNGWMGLEKTKYYKYNSLPLRGGFLNILEGSYWIFKCTSYSTSTTNLKNTCINIICLLFIWFGHILLLKCSKLILAS